MKKIYISFLLALLTGFTTGCSDEDVKPEYPEWQVENPIVMAGKAYTFDDDTEGIVWERGRNVGVFVSDNQTGEGMVEYSNVHYLSTVKPMGYFTPYEKEDVIGLPGNGDKVNVSIYYPYAEDIQSVYHMNMNDKSQYDYLTKFIFGRKEEISKDNNQHEFELKPVLAQIVFNIVKGDGMLDEYLEGVNVRLKGMNTEADLNLNSGNLENVSNLTDMILSDRFTEEDIENDMVHGGRMLLLPSDAIDESVFAEFTFPKIANRTDKWIMKDEISSLKAGKRYICTVTVNQKSIEVETSEESIPEWGDGSNTDVPELKWNGIETFISEMEAGDFKSPVMTDNLGDLLKVISENDKWCGVYRDKKGEITSQYNFEEKYISFSGSKTNANYANFVMGSVKDLEPNCEYTLTFQAKSDEELNFRCYFKFVYDKSQARHLRFEYEGNGFITMKELTSNTDWAEYTVKFYTDKGFDKQSQTEFTDKDDNKMINLGDAENKDLLKKLAIAFYPCTANKTYYIKDVSITKVGPIANN